MAFFVSKNELLDRLLAGPRCMPAVGAAQRGLHGDDLMNNSILACERDAVEGRPKS